MPADPTVCAIMLANGRESMVARAVRSFKSQTFIAEHPETMLLILDTGDEWPGEDMEGADDARVRWVCKNVLNGKSIGYLRNRANAECTSDILIHWDSDDWSHPNRIAEQVAHLQASGAECVGYREMLFWDSKAAVEVDLTTGTAADIGETWIYTSSMPDYCLGTSMCYWRRTWEEHPFADTNHGCDDRHWMMQGVKMAAVSSYHRDKTPMAPAEPRMIASIHGGNTCASIDTRGEEWRRTPEWDEYCRGRMALG